MLRRVLLTNPQLRKCLTRCAHCRIYFLTDPRNRGRKDIRCPYGCRQAHRQKSSTKRSVAYYQTSEGKIKKRIQNSKRTGQRNSAASIESSPEQSISTANELIRIDETILTYLVTVTCLIEGRNVSLDEILSIMCSFLRQPCMYRHKKEFYALKNIRGDP